MAPSAVRQSSAFSANVTTASGRPASDWERSFVYQSIPRSGAGKRGYTASDGAEYAVSAGLSMSWTTFLYSDDVWVAVTHLGLGRSRRSSPPPNVTLRPRRVAASLEHRWLDGATLAIKIPHQRGGLRVSVEFDTELFDTFNDGTNCCQLTDKAGPRHAFVHRQPRHAMLIFAEPVLTAAEAPRLDPLQNSAVNGSGGGGSGGIGRTTSPSPVLSCIASRPRWHVEHPVCFVWETPDGSPGVGSGVATQHPPYLSTVPVCIAPGGA